MTPLKKQMIKDMKVRRLSVSTQDVYIRSITGLTKFYMKSPDKLTEEQIHDYLIYLSETRKFSWSTCNIVASAICFLYHTTLNHKIEIKIPPRKQQAKLPEILSVEELEKLFNVTSNFKHRVMLMTAYSAGLRVGELIRLKLGHIDSKRMLVRIEQSKGNKDRYTLLSSNLLIELRAYWRRYKPKVWLFPKSSRSKKDAQMGVKNAWRIYDYNRRKAGIKKRGGIHILRHCFATHLLESGVDLRKIQLLMGHKTLNTTSVYLQIAHPNLSSVKSPFDLIDFSNNKSNK